MMEICKVLIKNWVVVDACIIRDIPFPNDVYRSDLVTWIAAPLEVGIGWSYDGEKFTPPEG